MATEVTCYVDPDAVGSANGTSWTDAYISWGTAEAANYNAGSANLVSEDEWCNVLFKASSGSADTTQTTCNGLTTDATRFVRCSAASGDEAVKTGWDASRYRLDVTDPGYNASLNIADPYYELIGLQIRNTYSADNADRVLFASPGSGTDPLLIDGCLLTVTGSGSRHDGIRVDGGTTTIQNTIIEATDDGIIINSGTCNCYHSVVRGDGGDIGIVIQAGNTLVATNNAIFNNQNDISDAGTSTIDHCASDDGDGTNAVAPSGSDWDNEFTDPANGDFTLLNTGNCYQGGTTGTGVSTDIEGDSYDGSNPSIGCDEYVAAGGENAPTGHLYGPLVGPLGGPI